MTAAEWIQVNDVYRSDAYEIAPAGPYDGRGWLLRSVEGIRRFIHAGPSGLHYGSLKSAKDFAKHYELESVRRAKQLRHGVLGAGGLSTALSLLWVVTEGTDGDATGLAALAFVFLFVGLREGIYFQASVATGSDYYYRRHSLGIVDRTVSAFAVTVVRARRERRFLEPQQGGVEIVAIDLDDFVFPPD